MINLTGHSIDIHHEGGVLTISPSGSEARVSTTRTDLTPVMLAGWVVVPVSAVRYGKITGLPAPRYDGQVYLVSGMVLAALEGSRDDVYAPGELVRHPKGHPDEGQPCGCTGLTGVAT